MNQIGIIERVAHWAVCLASLALWLILDTDFENALWWAAKMDAHKIAGSVRPEKVALCLTWSLCVFVVVHYRYRATMRAVFSLLASILIVQILFSLVEINTFAIPGLYLISKYLFAAIVFWLTPIVISTLLADRLVTRQIFLRMSERIVTALTLCFSAMMIWVSFFDLVHPSIVWR